jgi:pimeloyl-ACP methyl ester carboxylesterase
MRNPKLGLGSKPHDDLTPQPSRRAFAAIAAAAGVALARRPALGALVNADVARLAPYGNGTLPAGIRSRTLNNGNGLSAHVLEAGYETAGRPALLLLHGFPELAYSWRKVMPPLAAAGYHVIAPDQRGYGRTTGWDDAYDADLGAFSFPNLVTDAVGLLSALGYRSVPAVIGHDAGSPAAAWCALIRPEVFRSVMLMSAPFVGPPALPFNTAGPSPAEPKAEAPSRDNIDAALAALPRPRKYYQTYYTTRPANDDMRNAPQGLHDFLRAYYYYKSADWKGNKPFPLAAVTAEEFAKMPTYYVMDRDRNMAQTVAAVMPSADEIAACKWLSEAELEVYVSEYGRTGFQGGLQGYRRSRDPRLIASLRLFSGRTIDVPASFVGGKSDWGVYQNPGALDVMKSRACTQMLGIHLVDGAGHWVQQEQPEKVSGLILQFLENQPRREGKL